MEYPSIRIQPGPDNCFSYAGSLEKLNTFFTEEELKNSLWLHGEKAGKAAAPYLPEAYTAEGTRSHVIKGHCTHEAVNALAEEATTAPAIIGIGGGTVLDTAKALSEKAHKPFVAIPTIAATCAAWTRFPYGIRWKARLWDTKSFQRQLSCCSSNPGSSSMPHRCICKLG